MANTNPFYNSMYGALYQEASSRGLPNPEVIAHLGAAQASNESAYGRSAPGNNYFGIKGPGQKLKTSEFVNGQMTPSLESFRKYSSMQDSASGYLDFLSNNGRYRGVLNARTPEEAIALQGKTGYATDPEYGSKLANIYRNNGNNMPPPPNGIMNQVTEEQQPVTYRSQAILAQDPNAGILDKIRNTPGLSQGLLQMGAGLLSQTGAENPLAAGLSKGFSGFNEGYDQGIQNSRSRVTPIGNGAFSQIVLPDGSVSIVKNPGVAEYNQQMASNKVRPPAGFRYTPNGDLEVIPGGPVAAKNAKADEAEASKNKMAEGAADASITAIDDALKIIDGSNVLGVNTASGIIGQVTGGIGQTPAYDLKKAVETVKANVGFQQLQQMREASPTGGALGQVAVQELTYLQAAVASLDTAQSPEQLKANLTKVRLHFSNWKDAVTKAKQEAPRDNTGGDKVSPPGKVESGPIPDVSASGAPKAGPKTRTLSNGKVVTIED